MASSILAKLERAEGEGIFVVSQHLLWLHVSQGDRQKIEKKSRKRSMSFMCSIACEFYFIQAVQKYQSDVLYYFLSLSDVKCSWAAIRLSTGIFKYLTEHKGHGQKARWPNAMGNSTSNVTIPYSLS